MPQPITLQSGHWCALPNARLKLCAHFIPPDRADELFGRFRGDIAWEQPEVTVYGKCHKVPRLCALYGDPGLGYRYSGATHTAQHWTPALLQLRDQLEQCTGEHFNSVLANWYRDGEDSNGWHADNEPELGPCPQIASLSFGASRDFQFRHRTLKEHYYNCVLENGSLLLMFGDMQRHWLHQLPKRRGVRQGRINLTFRNIVAR